MQSQIKNHFNPILKDIQIFRCVKSQQITKRNEMCFVCELKKRVKEREREGEE